MSSADVHTYAESSTSTGERPAATLPLPNALAYTIAAVAFVVAVIQPFAVVSQGLSMGEAVEGFLLQNGVFFALLGALILQRRPGHVIGWLLVVVGGLDAMTHLSDEYQLFQLGDRPGFPETQGIERLIGWVWVPTVAGIGMALPQLFPDGRLLSPRWRWLAVLGASVTVLLSTLFLIDPNGTGLGAFAVVFPLFGLAMLASLVPLLLRYRRSRGIERQQLKWAFYGLVISTPLIALGTAGAFWGASAAWSLPALVILPAAITVAVLRYRLYDVDVVISRTLLVAGLVGFITVAYVAIVVGVGSLVGGGGGGEPNVVLSVLATAVVAVAFQPVRRGLQRVANRVVFGRRATPYDVLSGFAVRVGAAEPSAETLVELAGLMAGGTGAEPARVWLRVGSQLRPAAMWPVGPVGGEPAAVDVEVGAGVEGGGGAVGGLPDADLAVPVVERGELLGVLTIAKPRGERVSEVDADLVQQLAAASGVVLRNLRLDAELAQRLVDLQASRRRLVSAQDDARRGIEADLAGGSRALLCTLRERLEGLAADVDADTAPKSAKLLGQLVESTDGALETLAGLAAGVYPPRLAAEGLAVALSEQATKAAVPVTVQAAGVGRYLAEVEAAVYFAVLEALQNVAKYAAAGSALVRLHHDGELLSFEVVDDGAGFDPDSTTLGTGLQGIVDRLDTVGGTLMIDSAPGAGTTITGNVPTTAAPTTAQAEPQMAGATP